jgi:hypothetical protein
VQGTARGKPDARAKARFTRTRPKASVLPLLTSSDLPALQRLVGNQAVQRMVRDASGPAFTVQRVTDPQRKTLASIEADVGALKRSLNRLIATAKDLSGADTGSVLSLRNRMTELKAALERDTSPAAQEMRGKLDGYRGEIGALVKQARQTPTLVNSAGAASSSTTNQPAPSVDSFEPAVTEILNLQRVTPEHLPRLKRLWQDLSSLSQRLAGNASQELAGMASQVGGWMKALKERLSHDFPGVRTIPDAQELTWEASGEGSYTGFVRWLYTGDEAEPASMNCWEYLLYFACKQGHIDRATLKAAYLKGSHVSRFDSGALGQVFRERSREVALTAAMNLNFGDAVVVGSAERHVFLSLGADQAISVGGAQGTAEVTTIAEVWKFYAEDLALMRADAIDEIKKALRAFIAEHDGPVWGGDVHRLLDKCGLLIPPDELGAGKSSPADLNTALKRYVDDRLSRQPGDELEPLVGRQGRQTLLRTLNRVVDETTTAIKIRVTPLATWTAAVKGIAAEHASAH